MTDQLSPERRSNNMRRIRSRDTIPEMAVRRRLHGLGYRYRLHARDLPGHPDIVFRRRRKVVFVHGCFWHQHAGCREGRIPGSNTEYWTGKLARTVERDRQAVVNLHQLGFETLTVWECHVAKADVLKARLTEFLGPAAQSG